jgi:hypothetical protein
MPANTRHQARGTAGARDERRLFPVACMPLVGPAVMPGSPGKWFLTPLRYQSCFYVTLGRPPFALLVG